MNPSRRGFLRSSVSMAASFCALKLSLERGALADSLATSASPYGPPLPDPHGILDLPEGFTYQVISHSGERMDDGYITPGLPDGMAAFEGPDGLTIVVMNHEMMPQNKPSPFAPDGSLLRKNDKQKLYDPGPHPHRGGTTTIVYDTANRRKVRQYLSLAGTSRNCAGGPTPWNSWITCEETVITQGASIDPDCGAEIYCSVNHGYNFEVPASAKVQLNMAVPLKEMGRFNHEAVAVDPKTGIVYQTEDRDDGLIYRYLPNVRGQLASGGRLQALCLRDFKSADTRNWKADLFTPGESLSVQWLDLENIESPDDDLRYRGFESGAARFARGEGMWYSEGQVFFACTNGGKNKTGQIWRYIPLTAENLSSDGSLELFIEPNDSALLESADNLTMAPWGDLVVCEDRDGDVVRLIGVTMEGKLYTLAHNHLHTEFAGVAFSPDGSALFVNLQQRGLTVAITGPWITTAS